MISFRSFDFSTKSIALQVDATHSAFEGLEDSDRELNIFITPQKSLDSDAWGNPDWLRINLRPDGNIQMQTEAFRDEGEMAGYVSGYETGITYTLTLTLYASGTFKLLVDGEEVLEGEHGLDSTSVYITLTTWQGKHEIIDNVVVSEL